jgi:cobalamin biosynthesis protein CobC
MMSSPDLAPLDHGGDLGAARKLFPGAPEPFLDLSTGINPNPYQFDGLAPEAFTRLPQPELLANLKAVAAAAYGAPSAAHVVAAPGSQIVVTQLAAFAPPGRAAILGPTYAEHARAASFAGHEVVETRDADALAEATLAIVVNPNNPDGRVLSRDRLLSIAERLRRHDGLLIVDEAFMEAGPQAESLADAAGRENLAVLRSFGKFYGLPGLRLSFALASPDIARRLDAALGPWPVSGAALSIGAMALADSDWNRATRAALERAALRLDALLAEAGLSVAGGTSLFRLVETNETNEAEALFRRLGEQGVLVRSFARQPHWLRFGLPGDEADWQRLAAALQL